MLSILLVLLAPAGFASDEARLEAGPRLIVVTAGGMPANDMVGYGIQAAVRRRPSWRLGFALDSIGGDFEVPNAVVQIATPEVLDSSVEMIVASAWIERTYGRWFWTAGLGMASPEVEDLAGPVAGGGTFDLTTDPGTEAIASLAGGVRFSWGERMRAEVGLRLDRHLADWTVRDRVSGRTGKVDDYTARGLQGAVGWRF